MSKEALKKYGKLTKRLRKEYELIWKERECPFAKDILEAADIIDSLTAEPEAFVKEIRESLESFKLNSCFPLTLPNLGNYIGSRDIKKLCNIIISLTAETKEKRELTKKTKETIEKIQGALGDPKAPWYGSDVVAWVGDLIEEHKILENRVIDMSLAIIGWQKKLSFENKDELVDELERMINEAIK